MFWSDRRIHQWAMGGGVRPLDGALINPASIDLRLGPLYRVPQEDGWSEPREIPETGLELVDGDFVLMHTLEYVTMPDSAVGLLCLKSSTGRKGLEHLHAGYIDPGFRGEITLEVVCHWPYGRVVHVGERFCQLVLACVGAVDNLYGAVGHYQGQVGPTPNI